MGSDMKDKKKIYGEITRRLRRFPQITLCPLPHLAAISRKPAQSADFAFPKSA
jgi:hypothetical protein